MPTKVLMPQMGESIFEGTVTKWLKKVGDKVERDEPLFEISTDKVDAEIPAPAPPKTEAKPAAVAPPPKPAPVAMPPAAVGGELTFDASKLREMGIRTSPLVRRLAKEHSVDLRQLTGSGAGGRAW